MNSKYDQIRNEFEDLIKVGEELDLYRTEGKVKKFLSNLPTMVHKIVRDDKTTYSE